MLRSLVHSLECTDHSRPDLAAGPQHRLSLLRLMEPKESTNLEKCKSEIAISSKWIHRRWRSGGLVGSPSL